MLPQLVAMDLVIRNGIIVDGNGGPAFVGDVGVKDGLVAQVGDLAEVVGIEEIDATGKHVMPGARTATGAVFFSSLSLHCACALLVLMVASVAYCTGWTDVHTHYDAQCMWGARQPKAFSVTLHCFSAHSLCDTGVPWPQILYCPPAGLRASLQ